MLDKFKSGIRLQTMVKTNNGFEIAETDLKLRGPGDIFSTKQSGFPDLKYADIVRDVELISLTKNIAFDLINKDPSLEAANNSVIRKNLIEHYSDNLQYAKIA
jgi:ATP-dependent DNA helicase RecG